MAGIKVNLPHAQQAMRDFEHEVGHPYSLLYVDLYAGSPLSDSRCIRLVQQAENQFTFYNYHNQQAKALAVTNPSWGQSLAQVGEGHFMGVCDNYASEPAEGIWLVKRDSTLIFSLDISLHEQRDFTGMDKVRVDTARSLLRRILTGKD
ncbi:MAG: hypothetical protein ACRYF0_09385 [Janthinobacterium lividum]